MESFVKTAAVGIVVCILAVVVKRHSKEQALMLSLLTSVCILLTFFGFVRAIQPVLQQLQDATGLSGALIKPVYQCALIALISHFSAEICKDAQEGAIAQGILFLGTAVSLYVCLPLLLSVLTLIRQLMGGAG